MNSGENEAHEREQWIEIAVTAYMDLFVMMQFTAVSHWLMHELTFAQARVLIILAAKEALTISQLANALDVGKPTASIVVQQLVERGLATRTEGKTDRRQTLVRLSEQGMQVGAGRRGGREKQWHCWLSQLNDDDLRALARGLNALQNVVRPEVQSRLGGAAGVEEALQ